MSDEEIIALYFARDEQALAQTDAKYGPYCFSLANAILPSREDAEDHAVHGHVLWGLSGIQPLSFRHSL